MNNDVEKTIEVEEEEFAGSVGSIIEIDEKTGEVKVIPLNTEPEKTPVPKEEPNVEPEPVKNKEPEKKSRAKERISQLVAENKRLSAEKEEKDRVINETNAAFAKRMVDSLKREMDALKKQRQEALAEQDGAALNDIDDKIADIRDELRGYTNFVGEKPAVIEEKKPTTLPEAAERWAVGKEYLLDNSEYMKLSREVRSKVSLVRDKLRQLADVLIREGFSPEDDYFYEEIDIRMANAIPFYETLASEGIDGLQSEEDTTSSGETEKPRTSSKSTSDKAKAIPVKGSQSVSAPGETSTKRKVVLSKEQVSFWERHLKHNGITLEDYARSVVLTENRNR